MVHDAAHVVLPGEVPPGMLCPDCAREIPPQATGWAIPLVRRKPTLQKAYEAALANKPEILRQYMDPTRNAFKHGTMQDHDRIRPCHYDAWPSWFLAHCRTPAEVDGWVEKLRRWWTPPSSANSS